MGNSVPRHSFKYKVDPDVASTSSNESLPSPRCYRYNMTHGKSRGQHVTPAMAMEMPCDNLQHLCCGVDGTVWVCRRPQILQLGPKGQSMFLLEVKIEICGLAASNKGELVFTDGKNKRLISTRFDDEVITKKVMSTEEWYPIGVCCAENDDIIVGLFLPEEQGRVTRYSVAGETREIIQKDSSGNQLYKFPAFLAENGNGDVAVSDHLKRAVIVVDRWGRYRFTYTAGELNRPDAVPFLPFGICCDSFWNIIVADCCNDCVHLISVNGEFLHLLFDKQCGLFRPVALSMTKDKKLYVGDRNGIKIFKMDGQRISREVCKSSRANSLSSVGTNKPAGGNGLIKPGSAQGLVRTGSASSLKKFTAGGSTPSKPGCCHKAQTLPSVRSKQSESNSKPIFASPDLPENKSIGDTKNRKNIPVPSCTTMSSPSNLSQPLTSSNPYVMTSSTASTSQTSALLSSDDSAKQSISLTSPSQISKSDTRKLMQPKNNPSQSDFSIVASKESSSVTQSTVSSNTVTHSTVSSNTVTHSTVSPNTVTDSPASSNTVTHSIVLSNTVTHSTVSSNTVTHSPVLPNTVTLSTGSSNTLTHFTASKLKESSISSMTASTNPSIITSKASPQTTRPLISQTDPTKTASLTGTTKASPHQIHSSTSSSSTKAISSTGTPPSSVVLSTAQSNAMSSSVNLNETDKTMLESSNKSSCKTMPISPPNKSTVISSKANPKPTSSSPLKSKSTTVVSFVEPVTSVKLMTSKPSETPDSKNVRLLCNDTLEKGSRCDNRGVNVSQKVESNSRRTEQPQSEKEPRFSPGGRTELKSSLKPSHTTAKQVSSKSNEKVGEVHFAKDEEHSAQSKPCDKTSSQVSVKTRETTPSKSPSKGGKTYRDSNIIESTRI